MNYAIVIRFEEVPFNLQKIFLKASNIFTDKL